MARCVARMLRGKAARAWAAWALAYEKGFRRTAVAALLRLRGGRAAASVNSWRAADTRVNMSPTHAWWRGCTKAFCKPGCL